MERIQGIKIYGIAALDAAGYDRHQIALNSAHIIMKELLKDAFFHADPHPGNLVVMPGTVIGAMDFGKVGDLSDRDRRDLTHLFILAMTQDTDGIVKQFIRMGAPSRTERRGADVKELTCADADGGIPEDPHRKTGAAKESEG
jgi:ubiquinone biosynthesis protein